MRKEAVLWYVQSMVLFSFFFFGADDVMYCVCVYCTWYVCVYVRVCESVL